MIDGTDGGDPVWRAAPAAPTLSAGRVHVWRARFDTEEVTDTLGVPDTLDESLLSPAERAAARRYATARDRARYVLRHAFLRTVLARYLGVEPGRVPLAASRYGKPRVAGAAASAELAFNASSSGDTAVLAVAAGRRLGVDLEEERRTVDARAVLSSFFLPEDVEALLSVPESRRMELFVHLWTGAEAFVKARGETIAHGLPDGSLSQTIAGWTARGPLGGGLGTELTDGNETTWGVRYLRPFDGTVCAVCVEVARGVDVRLSAYDFDAS